MSAEVCPSCGSYPHMMGARYCWVCGSPMGVCDGCANEDADRDQDCCWNCSRNRRTLKRDLFKPVAKNRRKEVRVGTDGQYEMCGM